MLDRVVIVIRQSPDWAALARDWRAGVPIDPARYVPPREIPAFPADIVDLIARWNALSAVDFFTCRQRLKEIAQAMLSRIERAAVVPCTDLPDALTGLESAGSLLFFCDDDDWFAPRLASLLSPQDFNGADVAVFPFVRFGGKQTCTYMHAPYFPRAAVGPPHPFTQRYFTNNYGLAPRMWRPQHLVAMQDHCDASDFGDQTGLVDRHLAVIVGATSKTPCAASFLPNVVANDERFAGMITEYVREVHSYAIPDELAWMREPLAATTALFNEVLARMPAAAR